MRYTTVKNCRWANQEQTVIDCDVDFDDLVEEFIPFSASPTDYHGHGQEIYTRALAGDFGVIAPYTPPPEPTLEERIFMARQYRNNMLSDLDAITSNPLRWAAFSTEQQQAYAVYRQALLDVPQQAGFPDSVDWPTPPQ